PELDLDPGLAVLLVGLGQSQPALPAGEEAFDDLREVQLDGGEGLLEALLDGLGEVTAKGLELGEAALEVFSLGRELVEALLLGLGLLLREGVHLAELLPAALEPVELRGEAGAVVALGGLGAGGVEAALRLVALGVDARELDVERTRALGARGQVRAKLN